ncbi:MAG: trigger factor [Actinobacteria bacterium]|nr:trigger factor [Actinomycetota bacterium]
MKTEILGKEDHRVSLRAEVGPEDLEGILDQAYREIGKNVKIPGFRKGKVPRKVIDSHIGAEQVRYEAIKNNLAELYMMAVEDSGISPVSEPELEIKDLNKEGTLIFEAHVYVKPEVEIDDYKGIEVDSPDTEVSDSDLEDAIAELRERLATLEVIEGRPVEEGDYALFDYKVFAEGVTAEEAAGSDVMIKVGSGEFMEGFDEQLIGARKGDIIDVSLKVPEDFPEESIAGKTATFRTIVKEIKHKVLPPVDDNLAMETTSFETLEELKEDLRPKIENSKKSMAERETVSQLVKKLMDTVVIDLPEPMVRRQIDSEMEEFATELRMRGANVEDFWNSIGGSRKDFEDSIRERVEENIKSELILEAVADKENIEVFDEDAEEYIRSNASAFGGDAEKLIEMARERDGLSGIKANLRISKAVDVLKDSAVYTGGNKTEEEGESETAIEDNEKPVENLNNASTDDEGEA